VRVITAEVDRKGWAVKFGLVRPYEGHGGLQSTSAGIDGGKVN